MASIGKTLKESSKGSPITTIPLDCHIGLSWSFSLWLNHSAVARRYYFSSMNL